MNTTNDDQTGLFNHLFTTEEAKNGGEYTEKRKRVINLN